MQVFFGEISYLITDGELKTYEENGMADGEIKTQDNYNKAQKTIRESEQCPEEIIGKISSDSLYKEAE